MPVLSVVNRDPSPRFQIHRLGLHEMMQPVMVDRPKGTGDYLFMLFHSEVYVKVKKMTALYPSSSLMIWEQGCGHYYGNATQRWDHSWIHCSGTEIPRLLRAAQLPAGLCLLLKDPSVMEHFLIELAAELKSWTNPDTRILQNLFDTFIRSVARQKQEKIKALAPPALFTLRAYLEEHFAESLSLKDLAQRVAWSPQHLSGEFKRFFGVPVIHYVLKLRMNQAAFLLRDRNHRIGDVATLVGYPDLYTFSKMFKRAFGVSPRTFRERFFEDNEFI